MAKNKISEWSSTPANNTDIGGIDIAEGCAPSGINNAIRELMAQVKDMQAGTDGDNFTVGGNLSVTGTTTLTTALPVASGGTGVTTSTGSGSNVLSTSPTLVTPILGTPTSGTLTNCTGLPVATGISGLASGVATFLATPSSANLRTVVTDETGSGSLVFATSPTLVTPALGTPSSGTLTSCTGLPLTTGVTGTLPVANGGTGVTTSTGTGSVVLSASPALTGTPTAPTAAGGTNTTQIATTAFVSSSISALGTMSTQNANNVAITGGSITGITDLAVADGGTGASTLTGVVIGNGTSAMTAVAPGTSGNVLTSNGTTWTSNPITSIAPTTGSAPYYGARAWVNFDGTGANGSKSIRASANVTSVVKNGTGNYTINFSTSMPDANYCATGSAQQATGRSILSVHPTTFNTSSLVIVTTDQTSTYDSAIISVAIFR